MKTSENNRIIQGMKIAASNGVNKNNGQVMILSVMLLSGILLSASAIAGLLMIYQIKNANDAVNSAKALFAADAGIEFVSWCYFKADPADCDVANLPATPPISFNESSVSVEIQSFQDPTTIDIISKGYAADRKIIRILETIFENSGEGGSAPSTPSGLSATPVSVSQINLSWTDNSTNETGFLVYRSLSSDLSNPTIINLGANTTFYSSTGLSSGTTYFYQVYACNTVGCSGSNITNATTF